MIGLTVCIGGVGIGIIILLGCIAKNLGDIAYWLCEGVVERQERVKNHDL